MKYKGIIFDLDGVICSTDHLHYKAWKQLADKLNIPFDEDKKSLLNGVSRQESLEIVLGDATNRYTDEEKLAFSDEKNATYIHLLKKLTAMYLLPIVKKTLEILKIKGYKLAIGSSSKNARFLLNQLGLGNFFHTIVDGTNIKNTKPNPEIFIKACDQLHLTPKKCVVVEDAVAGVTAARAGGFDVITIGQDANDGINKNINTFDEMLCLV